MWPGWKCKDQDIDQKKMFSKKTVSSSWTESVLISNNWIKSRQWKFKVDTKNFPLGLDLWMEDCKDENQPKWNESVWSHKTHGETGYELAA